MSGHFLQTVVRSQLCRAWGRTSCAAARSPRSDWRPMARLPYVGVAAAVLALFPNLSADHGCQGERQSRAVTCGAPLDLLRRRRLPLAGDPWRRTPRECVSREARGQNDRREVECGGRRPRSFRPNGDGFTDRRRPHVLTADDGDQRESETDAVAFHLREAPKSPSSYRRKVARTRVCAWHWSSECCPGRQTWCTNSLRFRRLERIHVPVMVVNGSARISSPTLLILLYGTWPRRGVASSGCAVFLS